MRARYVLDLLLGAELQALLLDATPNVEDRDTATATKTGGDDAGRSLSGARGGAGGT